MKLADLDWDELQTLIRECVHEELRDLITDPDWGPELPDEIRARLQASLASKDRIPFEEMKRRLNLA
jgi:hypothetical protein